MTMDVKLNEYNGMSFGATITSWFYRELFFSFPVDFVLMLWDNSIIERY
jgi:hypothetical protein